MKTKVFGLVLVCLFIYGCATAPVPRQITKAFPIEAPFDDVWQAVIESFSDLQLPIDNMEKDSGLITTDWIDIKGQKNTDYCDCGGLGINIEQRRVGKFNVFVKRIAGDSCEIRINCMYEQTISDIYEKSFRRRKCVSTGKLEAEMFNLIKSKLSL